MVLSVIAGNGSASVMEGDGNIGMDTSFKGRRGVVAGGEEKTGDGSVMTVNLVEVE